MFSKTERSSFKYWFAHWCAFNMTALNLKVWRFKYLFHDAEKPWLKLLFKDYKKVQKFHREHNRHHFEYKGKREYDYMAMVIDWECSHLTKESCPARAREKTMEYIETKPKHKEMLETKIIPILNKLNL